MSYKFSYLSAQRLEECEPALQSVCNAAIQVVDFSVLCGYRTKEEQNAAYAAGTSKLQFPSSKHNSRPSMAVDIAPYPIDWDDLERFHHLAGVMDTWAKILGIPLIWGGRWTTLKDYLHWELPED